MPKKSVPAKQVVTQKPGPASSPKGPGSLSTRCPACGGSGHVSSPRGNCPCVVCRGSGVAPIGNSGRIAGK
jgi:DnaJ-class molecular chaperone